MRSEDPEQAARPGVVVTAGVDVAGGWVWGLWVGVVAGELVFAGVVVAAGVVPAEPQAASHTVAEAAAAASDTTRSALLDMPMLLLASLALVPCCQSPPPGPSFA